MCSRGGVRLLLLFAWILVPAAVRGQASLQQDLARQFVITRVANDGSVVNAGSSLVLHRDFITYSIISPQPALSTWKDGKMSLSFSRNVAIGMVIKGNGVNDLPKRKFVNGELLWLIGIMVEKDAVVFRLLSDAYDGIRYYGDLKFPFPKNSQPTLEQAVRQINEVISVQPPDKPATEAAPPAAAPAPRISSALPLRLPSRKRLPWATHRNAWSRHSASPRISLSSAPGRSTFIRILR